VLLMHVASVQKLPLSTVGAPLQIRCKTFLSVTFVLPKERECHDLYTSLVQMSQPCKLRLLRPFVALPADIAECRTLISPSGRSICHVPGRFTSSGTPVYVFPLKKSEI
jgi:hypothetical protein